MQQDNNDNVLKSSSCPSDSPTIASFEDLVSNVQSGNIPKSENDVPENLREYYKIALIVKAASGSTEPKLAALHSKSEELRSNQQVLQQSVGIEISRVQKELSKNKEDISTVAETVSHLVVEQTKVIAAANVVKKIGNPALTDFRGQADCKVIPDSPSASRQQVVQTNTDKDIFANWYAENTALGGIKFREYFTKIMNNLGFQEAPPSASADTKTMKEYAGRYYEHIVDRNGAGDPKCKAVHEWFCKECAKAKK